MTPLFKKLNLKDQTEIFVPRHGWAALGKAGFEGVRQVAIDEDWSALRFRRVEFIRSMTREQKRAMTDKGKARVEG